ncbi:cyclin-dependent kinase inhibitor 7 [Gastrolobium bilobum]|uniref:cyclin-dependent kinase inhibitor 7 n=1 Tax=Gastrolobium bilobum TaxID=150636 RepID=UPI002AB2000B|nr:cyclin-dependent kinase inhibitor 7 [Gastrolobium bilobum]
MGDDCKRCAPTIAAMEDASLSGTTISKKRKTNSAASRELQLHFSDMQYLSNSHYSFGDFPDITVSPETSVNSTGTVVSGEFYSDRSPLSCCSSTYVIETGEVVKELETKPLDLELQTKGFETVDSTNLNFKSFSLLSELSGDSEESTMFPAISSAAASEQRNFPAVKTPPEAEIEEFFAMAEKYEQKRFAEKYNFDIVRDMPLEGRYQWVRLH